jgi:hypothetical protein
MLPKQSSLPPNFVFDFSPPNSTHASTTNLRIDEEIKLDNIAAAAAALTTTTTTTDSDLAHKEISLAHIKKRTKQKSSPNEATTTNVIDHKQPLNHSNLKTAMTSSKKTLLERRGFTLSQKKSSPTTNNIINDSQASSVIDLTSDLDSVDKLSVGFIIKRNELKEEQLQKLKVASGSSRGGGVGGRNDSINNESDNISAIMKLRKLQASHKAATQKSATAAATMSGGDGILKKRASPLYLNEFDYHQNPTPVMATLKNSKNHFSPQSSVRIRVIDETDTDN